MIVKIGLIGVNQQEVQILETVLTQRKFEVKIFAPSTGSYLEIMKFKPDAILMEMPNREVEQIHLVNLIRGNKKIGKLPILCYGHHTERSREKQYALIRISKYFQRPLKISNIFSALIETVGPDIEALINGAVEKEGDERAKDILLIMKPDTLGSQKIDLMVKHVGKLMAFPFSIAKIVQLTGSENSSASELANVIRSDASIATNIIKLSNSIFFSSRNREIKDVVDAIVRIGFNETKKIALGLTVMQLLDNNEKNFGFDRQKFWYHSLGTALIAEKLAKSINYPNPSLAFLTGLLHEFAALLYDEFFGELFETLMEHTTKNRCTFVDSGLELIKLDQNDFMGEMFKSWNMPKDLIVGLKEHTRFLTINESLPQEQSQLAKIVGFSDLLAKSANIGRSCDEQIHEIPDTLLQQFKLPIGIRKIFFDSIYSQIDLFVMLLNLEKTEHPNTKFKSPTGETSLKMVVLRTKRQLYSPHLFYLEHLGFEEVVVDSTEALQEKISDIDLVVYNISDEGAYESIEAMANIVKESSIPSLLFYNSPGSEETLPKIDNCKVLLTLIDTVEICEAVKEVMGEAVTIPNPAVMATSTTPATPALEPIASETTPPDSNPIPETPPEATADAAAPEEPPSPPSE